MNEFFFTRNPVFTRGSAPVSFLEKLVAWGLIADDEIFAPRRDKRHETDIYTAIKPKLSPNAPWVNLGHRRAVMLEVLRVLAGFESSWKPLTGADTTNPRENDDETYSAGLWQISYNSRVFGEDLRALLQEKGIRNGKSFQNWMKTDFNFAAEYTARLLRHTIRHNGPVRDHYIDKWLSADAVQEFRRHLNQVL